MSSEGDTEELLNDQGGVAQSESGDESVELLVETDPPVHASVSPVSAEEVADAVAERPVPSNERPQADPATREAVKPPPSEGALTVAAPAKRRKERSRPLKPRTSGDADADPIEKTGAGGPKLKQLKLTGRPVGTAHDLVKAVLTERTSSAPRALWQAMTRMSKKRAAAHGTAAGLVAVKALLVFGPLGLLIAPASMIVDRVRAGRINPPEGKTEAEMLTGPSMALMRVSEAAQAIPWELRSQWMIAAWRFFCIVSDFNARVEVVNDALGDATMSATDHQNAMRMADLLSREYVRLEGIRRFLEEDLYGDNVKRPLIEMIQYDAVVMEADLFGLGDGRQPSIDWLCLPHKVFTRRQLAEQLRRDIDTIASLRAVQRDDVEIGIVRLERDLTGKRRKLPPPSDD